MSPHHSNRRYTFSKLTSVRGIEDMMKEFLDLGGSKQPSQRPSSRRPRRRSRHPDRRHWSDGNPGYMNDGRYIVNRAPNDPVPFGNRNSLKQQPSHPTMAHVASDAATPVSHRSYIPGDYSASPSGVPHPANRADQYPTKHYLSSAGGVRPFATPYHQNSASYGSSPRGATYGTHPARNDEEGSVSDE